MELKTHDDEFGSLERQLFQRNRISSPWAGFITPPFPETLAFCLVFSEGGNLGTLRAFARGNVFGFQRFPVDDFWGISHWREMNEKYEEIVKQVIDSAIKIHRALGPGLLESVYEVLLAQELQKRGLKVERQKPIPIVFEGKAFDEGFRADLWIEPDLIVELKSLEALAPVHLKQMLTYLRMSEKPLGLLINFGEELLKTGLRRVINNPEFKRSDRNDSKDIVSCDPLSLKLQRTGGAKLSKEILKSSPKA